MHCSALSKPSTKCSRLDGVTTSSKITSNNSSSGSRHTWTCKAVETKVLKRHTRALEAHQRVALKRHVRKAVENAARARDLEGTGERGRAPRGEEVRVVVQFILHTIEGSL